MTPARVLRLGTRGSLLAVAQSRIVAQVLAANHPGLQVELATLQTRGDRDLHTPLSAVGGANFFADALDAALLAGQVDCVVHSCKDLDGPRPPELVCAAMPGRADPRDVVLFRPDVDARLRAGQTVRIGSSSARRESAARDFLQQYLPDRGPAPALSFQPLRGAVDQRLAKLRQGHAAGPDGIILALAGLQRLWADADGRAALQPLLAGLRWMVLPLSAWPAAPGQGALVIECRRDDTATRALLARLHDAGTAARVAREQAAAAAVPADRRGAFAATAIAAGELGELLFTRAGDGDSRLHWPVPPRPRNPRPWHAQAAGATWQQLPLPPAAHQAPAVFAAHWRSLHGRAPLPQGPRLWVSGLTSWRQLARAGWWVEGCAEHLGFEWLRATLATPVLQLPPVHDWLVLTRAGAEPSWRDSGVGQVAATYRLAPADAAPPAGAMDYYWASSEQFRAARGRLPADARHACGPGKTAAALRALGVNPLVFPNRREWLAWVA